MNVENTAAPMFLTPAEVADMLRVTSGTLKAWRWQNKGPEYIKLNGGCVRYATDAVLAWLIAGQDERSTGEVT